jgi:ABC-type sugar transport system substrate-binding protein
MADFAQSLNVAENMLTAAPNSTGMFASNESSTVGAVSRPKRQEGVNLAGFDSSPQLLR